MTGATSIAELKQAASAALAAANEAEADGEAEAEKKKEKESGPKRRWPPRRRT